MNGREVVSRSCGNDFAIPASLHPPSGSFIGLLEGHGHLFWHPFFMAGMVFLEASSESLPIFRAQSS